MKKIFASLTLVILIFSIAYSQHTPSNAQSPEIISITMQQKAIRSKELQSLMNGFISNNNTNGAAIQVIDLNHDIRASVNLHQKYASESLYKLFVGYGIYKKIDTHTIKINTLILNNMTINDCLYAMIVYSDNDCGKALGELVGWKWLDATLNSEGYKDTTLNNYDAFGAIQGKKITSACDVGLLFQRLYQNKLLSTNATNSFLNLLKSQQLNDGFPSGIPNGVIIAHKTGEDEGYVHDAGIVYNSKNNYIAVMLTGPWNYPDKDAPPLFKSLSLALWTYFSK